MELMCIKNSHENGCMWPFEGYSPVFVVDVRHTRWVNSFSLYSLQIFSASLACTTKFRIFTCHHSFSKLIEKFFFLFSSSVHNTILAWILHEIKKIGTHETKQISHHWICKDQFLYSNHRIKWSFPTTQAGTSIVLVTQVLFPKWVKNFIFLFFFALISFSPSMRVIEIAYWFHR